jgi:hypothetical protein
MGNSRLCVFSEYLLVSQSKSGLQAFQQFDVSTELGCIGKALRSTLS